MPTDPASVPGDVREGAKRISDAIYSHVPNLLNAHTATDMIVRFAESVAAAQVKVLLEPLYTAQSGVEILKVDEARAVAFLSSPDFNNWHKGFGDDSNLLLVLAHEFAKARKEEIARTREVEADLAIHAQDATRYRLRAEAVEAQMAAQITAELDGDGEYVTLRWSTLGGGKGVIVTRTFAEICEALESLELHASPPTPEEPRR